MVKGLRIALAMFMVGLAVIANAQTTKSYTENLVVTINEESTDPQPTTVTVEMLESGNINFTLKNFTLVSGEDMMPVGNIAIKDLALKDEGYCKSFSFDGATVIEDGDDPEMFWLGSALGEIPMKLEGKMTDEKLYVTISIDMQEMMEQFIYVKLGEDIEAPAGPAVVGSKEYTENLVVTINEESTDPQPTTVVVESLEDGNINFTLKNFALIAEDGAMPVGNIAIKNIAVADAGYCKTFTYEGSTSIKAGDAPEYGENEWLGPMLPEIPMKLSGKMTDDELYVVIDIDMSEHIGQLIGVKLGEDILDPVEVAISSVESASKAATIFDLSGRRVNVIVNGKVYIENGKKVVK